jgi:hypothetical protein
MAVVEASRMRVGIVACFAAEIASAATLQVPGDFASIQDALDAAADGDTVLVAPGEYVVNDSVTFYRLHDPVDPESPPVRDVVLRSSAGAETTTIRLSPGSERFRPCVLLQSGETDAIAILLHVFRGDGLPCHDAADANDDGTLGIADAITMLEYVFGLDSMVPALFGRCDIDVTADALDCGAFPPCE